MTSPFTISVFTKSFQRIGVIGDPQSVTLTTRHNAQGTGTVAVRNNHPALGQLLTKGCRLTVDHAGAQVMSGVIDSAQGDSAPDGQVSLQLSDDFRLLKDVLAWPVPTAALTAQSVEYYTVSGPAETVLKTVVQANAVTRLGLPVTVATSLGRGSSIKVQWRFHPIADRLFPAFAASGLGVSVRQGASGLVVDCYVPRVIPQTLTPESGIVTSWEWDTAAPTATRVVAGGQGEGTARAFVSIVSTADETDWGVKREGFADANDVDNNTDLNKRAGEALVEGAGVAGLRIALTEAGAINLRVGDMVTTQLALGAPATPAVISEATLNWTKDNGFTQTPTVGDVTDDPDRRRWAAINANAKALRNLKRR